MDILSGVLILLTTLDVVGGFICHAPWAAYYDHTTTTSSIIYSIREDTTDCIVDSRQDIDDDYNVEKSRRYVLADMFMLPSIALSSSPSFAAAEEWKKNDSSESTAILQSNSVQSTSSIDIAAITTADTISVPLEYIPALSAYVIHYSLFGETFGAIVDTGSPFLACPSTCR